MDHGYEGQGGDDHAAKGDLEFDGGQLGIDGRNRDGGTQYADDGIALRDTIANG